MMKKLLSLVCCLLPMGVKAAPEVIPPIGADPAVSVAYDAWQSAIANGQSVVIDGGNGINATGGETTAGVAVAPGFAVANNMSVGELASPGTADVSPIDGKLNNLYVLTSARNPFTVISTGDVSIGSILRVLNGVDLGFKNSDSNPQQRFDLTVGSGNVNEGIYVGNTENSATLTLAGIDALTVNGSVITYGDFSVNANSVNVGAINVNAGDLDIESTGAVAFDGLVAGGAGITNVSGTTITSNDTVQNNAGDMTLTATGDIDVVGRLENAVASDMTISGGDVVVSDTVKNDNVGGTMTLNVAGLSVNGGAQDTYSFVNKGNFYATVDGETYLEYGLDLSGMSADNEFSLTTGTLVFGDNAKSDTWFGAFSNNLNNFTVNIENGDLLNLTTVLNGSAGNTNATMTIEANNIAANSVQNDAAGLTMNADQDITIGGAVVGNSGATLLVATDTLTVNGVVSNSAQTTLNANIVNVASLSNTGVGAELVVSSLTETSGTVNVDGDVTNALGTTKIQAKNIDITGTITNNGGTTDVRGSDSNGGAVSIGAMNVIGGVVNLDALAGDMDITNALTVLGGNLNIGSSLTSLTVGDSVQISGNLNATSDALMGAGDVNVDVSGATPFVMNADAILIGGDVNVNDTSVVRNIKLHAPVINISGNASVSNLGYLTLGTDATSYVRVNGDVDFGNGGTLESYANDVVVGTLSGNSKFIMHGQNVTADDGNIEIAGNVYFDADNDPNAPTAGLIVKDTNNLTLKTTASGADISVGAVSVGAGNTLAFNSADALTIGGSLGNNGTLDVDAAGDLYVSGVITNVGDLDVKADEVVLAGIVNTGNADIVAANGAIETGDVTNSGSLAIEAATDIVAGVIAQTGGVLDLSADVLQAQSVVISGNVGTQTNIDASTVEIAGVANVSGDFVQGGADGMLNLRATDFSAGSLTIGGDFVAKSGNTTYDIGSNISIAGNIDVADGAISVLDAGRGVSASDVLNAGKLDVLAAMNIELADITNLGVLNLGAINGIVAGDVINNAGTMEIDSGDGIFSLANLNVNAGNITILGREMDMSGRLENIATLYQNYVGGLSDGDLNIATDDYIITTAGVNVGAINQDGTLRINTSDVYVAGDIVANDLQFVAQLGDNWSDDNPELAWMNVAVDGSVSGGVGFVGLEKMDVGVNYTFDQNSMINAVILPYATGAGSTDINYWATVSLNQDDTLGDITNAMDGRALIEVGGKFTSGVEYDYTGFVLDSSATALGAGQIGINLFNVVDQGTAIWLVHANDGVENFSLLEQMRNLDVQFCNADGSLCYNYLDSLRVKNDTDVNGTDEDLPAYISVRDTDNDGVADSLYVVFDPRFGGPVLLENLKIQPIVGREPDNTRGEYVSAGALDNMLIGQAHNKKFLNGAPLEIVPIIFAGTNVEEMANQLYNRMEHYVETSEGESLARFSRLFQVREIEQIAGAIALNEHTSFRSFEDRMFDEFIWNRNRNLNKAWLDVDYGMFYQNIDDGKHTDGHRFSVAGGFDWQESNTLQLGLTGRVSHTTSKAGDSMDLSYTGYSEQGNVEIDVADTNIGLGGYLMKILGEKTRLYGNAFLDLHVLDVDRNQNYVDRIDGDGTAFSIMSEWGLMHDILNQYVVGNAYARLGYNFGFSVKEKVAGDDYMRLKSDGYFALTPGYSLIAQKRIYPSAWFQIRPYASIGVEYDVFGAPDYAKYKFVVAEEFTKYDIDIDPLWANIGGGVELLSARGLQFGIDYRYQYNDAIQLHNIKVSGSYRF